MKKLVLGLLDETCFECDCSKIGVTGARNASHMFLLYAFQVIILFDIDKFWRLMYYRLVFILICENNGTN